MTSQYNHNYSQYSHTGLDNQQDYRNSQMFWDAVSITSSDRNSIAMSVYHSVPELQYDEHAAMNQAYDRVSFIVPLGVRTLKGQIHSNSG